MRVYRIEDTEGRGPYYGAGFIGYDPPERHAHLQDLNVRPTPRNDGIDFDFDKDHCGFSSISALLKWFRPDDIKWLRDEGKFAVAIYEVPTELVKHGGKQVAFVKNHPKVKRIAYDCPII